MPYITKVRRGDLHIDTHLLNIQNAGELNFLFTRLAHAYLDRHGISYQRFNDVVGALEGAKLEIYRRHIAPYEDQKVIANGDVP